MLIVNISKIASQIMITALNQESMPPMNFVRQDLGESCFLGLFIF